MSEIKVGSILKIHQRLVTEGYHVSQHALRMWIKRGLIPAVHSGKKLLISYDAVVQFLEGGMSSIVIS